MTKQFLISNDVPIGGKFPPVLFAGPCVIEGEEMAISHAKQIFTIAKILDMPFVFKASYDKANRTSLDSYRGPGLRKGLEILSRVQSEIGVPVITDAHSVAEIEAVGKVVDVIQIPAFLCRQTDLLVAAAQTGKTVNVKKGQFLAPQDMSNVIGKLTESGCERILLTERGTSFGYNRLTVDFAGVVKMRQLGMPVVFDATHSIQLPGGAGKVSSGEGQYAKYLAWAAAAVGIDGLFVEVHEDPNIAKSDGPNMIKLSELEAILSKFKAYAAIGH